MTRSQAIRSLTPIARVLREDAIEEQRGRALAYERARVCAEAWAAGLYPSFAEPSIREAAAKMQKDARRFARRAFVADTRARAIDELFELAKPIPADVFTGLRILCCVGRDRSLGVYFSTKAPCPETSDLVEAWVDRQGHP